MCSLKLRFIRIKKQHYIFNYTNICTQTNRHIMTTSFVNLGKFLLFQIDKYYINNFCFYPFRTIHFCSSFLFFLIIYMNKIITYLIKVNNLSFPKNSYLQINLQTSMPESKKSYSKLHDVLSTSWSLFSKLKLHYIPLFGSKPWLFCDCCSTCK